ncbi:MAG: hypothetical protein PHH40_01760 [Candidatus Moranbacteria bacterium]|nr:hypothetical protein [Candidatus Moranbacteria bacterium]MDD3965054.1 hypothetical protein [Candidatus Moranbacteria bacterium]
MFSTLTKRDTIGLFLLFLIGVWSVFLWRTLVVVISFEKGSSLAQPLLFLVLLAICFFIGSVLWKQTALRLIATALIILPGIFFFLGWEYIIVSVGVSLIFLRSSANIFAEGKERTRFHFFRSVKSGSMLFFLGIALLFSTGYYSSLKETVWEDLIPRFRISQGMTSSIFKIAGTINPSFAQLTKENVTVDEFLLNLEKQQQIVGSDISSQKVFSLQNTSDRMMPVPVGLPLEISPAIARQLFLEEGRTQIASFVGRPVDGSEKIADILSLIVQNKLTSFLQGEQTVQHIPSQAIPFFITLLLFITLLSLASVLNPLCVFLAQFIFWLILMARFLTLETVTVEQQRLVE